MRSRELMRIAIWHAVIILIIMTAVLTVQKKVSECEIAFPQADEVTEQSSHVTFVQMAEPEDMQCIENEEQEYDSSYNLTVEPEQPVRALQVTTQERYELAKLLMCEAEGESSITKALIAFVVINRVESNQFPDNIHDVIFEEYNGVYQFSPLLPGGSWNEKEPNEDCYRVVDMIIIGDIEDTSDDALYFEACSDTDNWHSQNLEYLFDSDNTRFYR